jgi:hypothetical protein
MEKIGCPEIFCRARNPRATILCCAKETRVRQASSPRCWAGILSTVLFMNSSPAAAQQSGGFPNLGGIGPSKAEVVGAIIGAVVVIGAVAYLVVPKQKTIEGCVS